MANPASCQSRLPSLILLLLLCSPSGAFDLSKYHVVPLKYGVNGVDFNMANTHGTVVLGWRENHNAHGFGVATFYLRKEAPDSRLELVGLWDKLDEKLYAVTSGGADCVLYDFRLLTSTNKSKPAVLIRADRDMGETFADKEKVTFRFYVLREGFEGIPQGDPGSPSYMF